jgi:hypothetical protein
MLPIDFRHEAQVQASILARETKKLKHERHFDILVYGGAALIEKKIDAVSGKVYMQRRQHEEHQTILPFTGLQFSRAIKKWDLRAGLELSIVGEKLNYSPYTNGTYYNSHGEWQPYQYNITHIDSTFIYGVIFTHTTTVVKNDSSYVNITDTLNGKHYNADVTKANGINRRYIVELPVEATYQLLRGRFGVGLSGGFAPGILVRSEGHYLLSDESGAGDLRTETKEQFTLNLRAGLEFSYLASEHLKFVLRPAAKFYLLDIDEKTGAGSKYRSYGIGVGVAYGL